MKIKDSYENSFPNPLSEEEEKIYLERMAQGDEQAKEKLILHNMRLVVHIAKKYFLHNEGEDLISVGYFGVVKGLKSFKKEKNIKLSTYLGVCIQNEILMHLRRNRRHENCVSLETALGMDKDGGEFKLFDILSDESNTNFLNEVNTVLDKDQIVGLIDILSDLERKVIMLRFGLEDGIIYAQKEVASALGFSRSYVSRLEKSAIEKMRNELLLNEKFRENSINF